MQRPLRLRGKKCLDALWHSHLHRPRCDGAQRQTAASRRLRESTIESCVGTSISGSIVYRRPRCVSVLASIQTFCPRHRGTGSSRAGVKRAPKRQKEPRIPPIHAFVRRRWRLASGGCPFLFSVRFLSKEREEDEDIHSKNTSTTGCSPHLFRESGHNAALLFRLWDAGRKERRFLAG